MASPTNMTMCEHLTTEEIKNEAYTTAELIFIQGFIPTISLFGILTNSAFLFVLYRMHDMRTITNFYLGNLAVADSMLLLIRGLYYPWMPLYSPQAKLDFTVTVFANRYLCGLPFLFLNFFQFVSVNFIVSVAFERYNSICRPFTHRRKSSRNRTVILTVFAWIIPLVIVLSFIGSSKVQCVESNDLSFRLWKCLWGKLETIVVLIVSVVQFCVALFGNCLMYIAIVRKLHKRNCSSKKKIQNRRNHVAKMLMTNACVFFICLLPMQIHDIYLLVDKFGDLPVSKVMFNLSKVIAIVFSLINSAINSLIYTATNPQYRIASRTAFTTICSNSPNPVAAKDSFPNIQIVESIENGHKRTSVL